MTKARRLALRRSIWRGMRDILHRELLPRPGFADDEWDGVHPESIWQGPEVNEECELAFAAFEAWWKTARPADKKKTRRKKKG